MAAARHVWKRLRGRFNVWTAFGAVVAAHVASFWVVGAFTVRYLLLLIGVTGILLGLLGWLQALIERRRARELSELTSPPETAGLPLFEAKARALRLMSQPDRWVCEPGAPLHRSLEELGLPAEVTSFFEKFASARCRFADLVLSVEEVSRSESHPGYLRIGHDLAESEVLVRTGEEVVYAMDPSEEIPEESYPSIYHLILEIDRIAS